MVVSPAYGFIVLALVKCSNDGGPGPRHNMKEDPGSSIFSMLRWNSRTNSWVEVSGHNLESS